MYKTHTLTVTGTVQLVLSIIYGLDDQDIMIHFLVQARNLLLLKSIQTGSVATQSPVQQTGISFYGGKVVKM